MLKILLFLTTFPFKHRQATIVMLMVASVVLFKYYELAPTGEKKNLNVGPFVVSLNMVHFQRRVDKPIEETAVMYPPGDRFQEAIAGSSGLSNGLSSDQTDAVAPSLPQNAMVNIQSAPENLGESESTNPDPFNQFQNMVGVSMTPPPAVNREAIRLSTVCLNQMDAQQFAQSPVQNALIAVAESCDLLAVQGIYAHDLSLIRLWVNELNQRGGKYAFLGDNSNSPLKREYVAFIYNLQTLAADRSRLIFLDTQNQLDSMPIAALFQARGMTSDRAFTFAAVNVKIPTEKASQALQLVMDLFDVVSRTISGEDDLVLLGDMGVNVNRRTDFMYNPNLFWTWNKRSDTFYNRPMTENIVFYKAPNQEYREESDLMDLGSQTGLSEQLQAEIFVVPPLWATFHVEEKR